MGQNNGQQLKKVRKIIGMTQEELSKRSGIHIGAIRSYEQGWANINNASITRVLKISKALGVEITDILDIDDF